METSKKKSVIDLKILGKEYKLGCEPGLEPSLIKAAQYLDYKMREIRDQHHVVGLDKIAVLAALHITHELLNNSSLNKNKEQSIEHKVTTLTSKIKEILNPDIS